MVRHVCAVQKDVFWSAFFQLLGVKGFAVDEIFHYPYLYRMAFGIVKLGRGYEKGR